MVFQCGIKIVNLVQLSVSVCNDEDGVMCKEVMNIKHRGVQTNSIEYRVACRLVCVMCV